MKTTKSTFVLTLLMLCFLLTSPYVYASSSNNVEELDLAKKLKALNLFQGVSDTDFALNKKLTRSEAIVLTLRLLGLEENAKNCTYSHPFKDVPKWADKYISYAYEKGISRGVSSSEFGDYYIPSYEFITFILRALEYSDVNNDFNWKNPYPLAESLNLIDSLTDLSIFNRADSVRICYNALAVELKDSKISLADKLIENNIFERSMFTSIYTELHPEENNADSSNDAIITTEEAEDIALAHYGILKSEVTSINTTTHLNRYVVIFESKGKQYFVKVHQRSKEIKEATVIDLPKPDKDKSEVDELKLTKEEALTSVLYYFSLSEKDISNLEIREDHLFYYIDFAANSLIFNVKINAYTNEITLYEGA